MTAVTAGRPLGLGGRGRLAWVVWRQHRAALIALGAVSGVLAALMLAAALLSRADWAILHHCATANLGPQCIPAARDFPWMGNNYYPVAVALVPWVLPVLAGMFLGAPTLAREYERGTTRFAWTQGTSRTRWALASLLALAVPVAACSAALGALAYWSLQPFEATGYPSRWSYPFDTTPVSVAAWALFGLLAGVTAGALLRRVVPAMAAAGGAVAILVLVSFWKLQGLLLATGTVVTRTRVLDGYSSGFPLSQLWFTLGGSNAWAPAGSWVTDGWFEGRNGQRLTGGGLNSLVNLSPGQQRAWMSQHDVSLWISYQPASHFWLLQGLEGAVLLALAVALGAATLLLVRRRSA